MLARASREVAGVVLPWFLRPVLHLEKPALQNAALAELVRLGDKASSGAVHRLAMTAKGATVREEAAAIARRFQFHVVSHGEVAPEAPAFPPVHRVWATPVDGAGTQAVVLARRWDNGQLLAADVLCKDTWGIRDAFGTYHLAEEELEDLLSVFTEGLDEPAPGMVEIDLPKARGIIAAAVEINAASRRPVLPGFEIWEPLFHDRWPPEPDERAEIAELDDARLAKRIDLYQRSGELLEDQFFGSWFFDVEEILPLLPGILPPSRGRMTDRQYRPLIEGLVDDEMRRLIRQRLRRQAWLLDRTGKVRLRDTSLAAAAQLAPDAERRLGDHPLLRAMIDRSIENAFMFAATDFL